MLGITKLPFIKSKDKFFTSYQLPDDLSIEQWVVAKGTKISTGEGKNFGWVVLPVNCIDKLTGLIIPKRIFKF